MGDKIQMRFRKKTSPMKKFLIIIGILSIFATIFFLKFRLRNIEVSESEYYTKEELKSYVKTSFWDNNTLFLYLKLRFGDKIEIPFVQKIDTVYVDSSTLKLEVYYKKIIGSVNYMNENIYFDKDGQVLEVSEKTIDNVPLFTGIHFKRMNLHEPLGVEDSSIFSKIMNISQLLSRYKLTIDKVSFDFNQNVTLYTKDIKVLLGNRTSYDEPIVELTGILPKLAGLKGELNLSEYTSGKNSITFKKTK